MKIDCGERRFMSGSVSCESGVVYPNWTTVSRMKAVANLIGAASRGRVRTWPEGESHVSSDDRRATVGKVGTVHRRGRTLRSIGKRRREVHSEDRSFEGGT